MFTTCRLKSSITLNIYPSFTAYTKHLQCVRTALTLGILAVTGQGADDLENVDDCSFDKLKVWRDLGAEVADFFAKDSDENDENLYV